MSGPLDLDSVHRDWNLWEERHEADDLISMLLAEVRRLRTFCDHMGDNDHDAYGHEIEFNCVHCGAHVRGVLDWDDRPCDVWRSVQIIPGVLR